MLHMRAWKKSRGLTIPLALLLAGCAGAGDAPVLEVPSRPLPPPGELFHQADVNAENEIDPALLAGLPPSALEPPGTAPSRPAPATPPGSSAPKQASREPSPKPASRPSTGAAVRIGSVSVVRVRGAPGKGNAQLQRALRLVLRKAGWPVYATPRKDSMRIIGKVELGPKTPRGQRVRLRWRVLAPNGKLLGVVKQDNVVQAGLLDEGFNEMALPAAEGAAEGIFKLVRQLR